MAPINEPVDDATKLISSMSVQEKVPALVMKLPEGLKRAEYLECPFNWIQFLRCGVHIGSPSTKKYVLDWVHVHDRRVTYSLRTMPTEYFVKKLVLCVLKASESDGGPKEASLMLDKLYKLVLELEKSQFSPEYKEGLGNLIVCTKHEIKHHFGFINSRGIKTPEPKMLEELSDAAKCPILAAKVYFCRMVKGSLAYQERLVKQIISYDKERAEWHHLFYSIQRAIRHQDEVRFQFRPDAFEIGSLSKAYSLDKGNLEILVSVWKTLFDMYKQKHDVFVQIDSLEFSCREAIGDYLSSSISDAVAEGKDYSVRALLSAAHIIGYYRLPEPNRQVDLAEKLMNKALDEWPNYSKVLNRLGLFIMHKKKDMNGAKEHFLRAITEDPSDAVSTIYYLWIDSSEGKADNLLKIDEILASKTSCQWPDHVRLDLLFLKGCIYFSKSNPETALNQWMKAQELSYKYFMTKVYSLGSYLRRYNWKIKNEDTEDRMTVEFIEKMVEEFSNAASSEEVENKGFFRLVDILRTVQKARARPQRDPEQEGRSDEPRGPRENQNDERPQRIRDGEKFHRKHMDGERRSHGRQDGERPRNWDGEKGRRDIDNYSGNRGPRENRDDSRPPRENTRNWGKPRDNPDNKSSEKDWRSKANRIPTSGDKSEKEAAVDEWSTSSDKAEKKAAVDERSTSGDKAEKKAAVDEWSTSGEKAEKEAAVDEWSTSGDKAEKEADVNDW